MKFGNGETNATWNLIIYISGHQTTGKTCTHKWQYDSGLTDQSWEGGWCFGGYELTTNIDKIKFYYSTAEFNTGRASLYGLTTA